jgi:hypothetical protein
MRRVLVPLALGMAAVYLALAVGVAGCLFTHVEQPDTGHHQTSHGPHSAFCAWACQANPAVSTLVEVPHTAVFQVVALLTLIRVSRTRHLILRAAHPRAPPSF